MTRYRGLDYPNREGHWPFHPKETSSTSSSAATTTTVSNKYDPDLTRPNLAYFSFLDRLIPIASSLGITLALVPTWGRYINGGYYGSPILFDQDKAYTYGYWLGKRYPFHPWILGGDSNRYWNAAALETIQSGGDCSGLEVIDYGNITETMAKGLIEGEREAIRGMEKEVSDLVGNYETFITFHSAQRMSYRSPFHVLINPDRGYYVLAWLPSAPEASSSAQFSEADWLTLDVIQTGHHDGAPKNRPPPPPTAATSASQTDDEEGSHAQAGAGRMPMWQARSSYIPIRKMYQTQKKGGGFRPVMDLEAHYENTHHFFQVGTLSLWLHILRVPRLMGKSDGRTYLESEGYQERGMASCEFPFVSALITRS